MAKTKKGVKTVEQVEPLPTTLAQLRAKAKENEQPIPQDGMFGGLVGKLVELLAPSEVPVEDRAGNVRRALREPLLMVSWDRAIGGWRWSITDKILQVSIRGAVASLEGLSEAISAQIGDGKVAVSTLSDRKRGH